jgi:hypothetical protein
MRRAMREGYGIRDVAPSSSYHGAYADALERPRVRLRAARSKSMHPGQLQLAGLTGDHAVGSVAG